MTLDRLAFGALLLLAALLGLGDVSAGSPLSTIRWLLPVALGLSALATVRQLPLALGLSVLATRWRTAWPRTLLWPLLAWLAVQGASAVLAPAHRLEALTALERPVTGTLLLWTVTAVCHTLVHATRLGAALAAGGIGVASFGLAQASGNSTVEDMLASLRGAAVPIGDVPRVASTLSHPNVAAIQLELGLPLLIAWTWTARGALRPPLAVATLGCLLAVVLTFSRAGILAALIALTTMATLSIRGGRIRPALYLALAALAVPLALLWSAAADPGLDRRLSAGLDEASSSSPSRLEYWSVAVRMAQDHPLLGLGPDNYRREFGAYSGLDIDNLGVHAHNQVLETLANTGVLGVLALVGLFGAVVRLAGRGLGRATPTVWPWRLALLGSLGAWLTHGLLDDFEHFWPAHVAFWLIAGLAVQVAQFEGAQESQQPLRRVALRSKRNASLHRLAPVFGSTAQRDDVVDQRLAGRALRHD